MCFPTFLSPYLELHNFLSCFGYFFTWCPEPQACLFLLLCVSPLFPQSLPPYQFIYCPLHQLLFYYLYKNHMVKATHRRKSSQGDYSSLRIRKSQTGNKIRSSKFTSQWSSRRGSLVQDFETLTQQSAIPHFINLPKQHQF